MIRKAIDNIPTTGTQVVAFAQRHTLVVFTCLVTAQLVKNGYQIQPNFDLAVTALAVDPITPFSTLPSGARYVTTSWFTPAFMHLLGITSESWLIGVHWTAAVGFLGSVFLCIRKYVSPDLQGRSAVVLGIAPFIAASFNWLGYDTVALLFMAQMLLHASRAWLVLPISVALGMQHFEIGISSTLGLLVAARLVEERTPYVRPKFFLISIAGLIIGRLVVQVVAVSSGGSLSGDDRIGEAQRLLTRSLAGFLSEPLATSWSVYGALWIFLLIFLARQTQHRWRLAGAIVLPIAIGSITIDSSRVGILGASMFILGGIALNPTFLRKISQSLLLTVLLVFVVVPRVWVWDGTPRGSCFSANVAAIVDNGISLDRFTLADCRIYHKS